MGRFNPDQKSSLIHSDLSRYKGIVVWWDRTRPPVIEPHVDDKKYVVKGIDRMDNMAATELGSYEYAWVIKRRNNIHFAVLDLIPNCVIWIPTLQSLRERGYIRT